MVSLSRAPAVLLVAAMLVGCGTAEPVRPDRFFALEPAIAIKPRARSAGATLMVKDFAARGFLGGRQIVYRVAEEPMQVKRYLQLLWEEPPGRALARELAGGLRAANLLGLVVTSAQPARVDWVLTGELARFEHLPTDHPPRVRIELDLTLLREQDRRSLLSRRYAGQEPTMGSAPGDMIGAFNRLSGRLLGQAVRDLEPIIARR
jgi:cholesterol transport system auxiliary component